MRPPSPIYEQRNQAYRLIAWESLVIAILAVFSLLKSLSIAVSFGLGGMAALLPQWYFAWRFFQHGSARAANLIIRSFYRGEIFKLILIGLLTISFWKVFNPLPLPFLIGLMMAQMGVFLTPWVNRLT